MTTAEVAQVEYLARSVLMEDEARTLPPSQPLSARYLRNAARIAYRASKAEIDNPDSPERMCGTCHGVRRCDIQAHRNRP